MRRRFWTAIEKAYLRRMYPDHDTRAIAEHLGRPVTGVYAMARKLFLSKSQAYLSENCRLKLGHQIGRSNQFRPGHVPANKGLRRPGYSPGRMADTQFKNGQTPGNTLPIGTIRANADGYLREKIDDAPQSEGEKGGSSRNWEFVHVRVWEDAHGTIPKGHRIWWKDHNHQNCALENLELVSGKEHMARTTIHSLPSELKEVIQLKGRLKRRIRTKERHAKQQQ